MKVIDLAQEIYSKRKEFVNASTSVSLVSGYHFCMHDHITDGVRFSVWHNGTDSTHAPLFNANLEVVNNTDYPESIDEARAALEEFLESEV